MVSLEQDTPNSQYRLYPGYRWSEKPSKILDHQAIRRLKDYATGENLKYDEPFWLAWNYSPWKIASDDFLLQFVDNPKFILNDTIVLMWRLFKEQRNTLIEANQALADAMAQGEDLTQ